MRTTIKSNTAAGSGVIPIPSFETVHVPPSPPPSSLQRWTYLLQVEAALQLRFKNRKHVVVVTGNDAPQTKKIISVEEFYAVVQKLHLSISSAPLPSTDQHTSNDNNTHSVQPNMTPPVFSSTEEQVLHDLVCVSAPILYRMVETSPTDSNNNTDAGAPSWALESVEFSGNRLLELKNLLQQLDPTHPDWAEKSAQMARIIKACRRNGPLQLGQPMDTASITTTTTTNTNPDNRSTMSKNNVTEGLLSEPYIHAGMTLEERVRARAAANQSRQSNALTTASAAAAAASDKKDDEASSASALLLAYADALWSHARYIMSRYQSSLRYRMSSPATKKTTVTNCCIMTLKDVVDVLSRTTTNQRAAAAATRRQMVDAVQQLSQLAPEWIILTDPEGGAGKGSMEGRPRLSKQTTVWIKPVEYGVIRARLGGTNKQSSGGVITNTVVAEGSTAEYAVAGQRHSNRDPPDSSWQTTPVAKKARTQLEESNTKGNENETTHGVASAAAAASRKMAAKPSSTEDGVVAPTKPHRFRMGLRINRNLIFTDADYDGGEFIEPTQFDSPRGLKRLFAQLNSGQRI